MSRAKNADVLLRPSGQLQNDSAGAEGTGSDSGFRRTLELLCRLEGDPGVSEGACRRW